MTTAEPLKPTFLIAGMQKAGTTTLHALLSHYSEVFMPTRKELHLFSRGTVTPKRFARYLEWFKLATADQARGEASPIYSYFPGALEQAAQWLGRETQIILILRDPVQRTYSHYWHEIKMGCEHLPFRQALKRYEWERRDVFYHRHHSYVGRSLYSSQVTRAQYLFGMDNVLILRLEDLASDTAGTLNQVADFVAPGAKPRTIGELPEGTINPARIPRLLWLNRMLGRVNCKLRRNITPRRMLEYNHVVGYYPRLAEADARYARDMLLEADPDLLRYYPGLMENNA